MFKFLKCTFGGLPTSYLVRQYIFGILITAIYIKISTGNEDEISSIMIVIFTINTFLYPYSRFVYESIVGFVLGENVFYVNAIIMLTAKIMTMLICWAIAVFIAPLGLAYLFFRKSRTENHE